MSKAKSDANQNISEPRSRINWTKPLKVIIMLGVIGGLGYCAWLKQTEIKNWFNALMKNRPDEVMTGQLNNLQQQVVELQNKLREVEYTAQNPDLSAIQKRIDDSQQISVNTIKSKADVETLLGLIVRMDKTEEKLRELAKVSDESALILTAAMLVKEAGERGGKFVYEAEVLSEVVKDNTKIKPEVTRLEEIAAQGVPSISELQKEFAEAYLERYPEPVAEVDNANNWKERVYNQLHKIIKIKKTDQEIAEAEVSPGEEDRAWVIVRDFVMSGEIIRAVGIAEKPLNHEMLANERFKAWLQNAKIYKDFYESISRITANGLAVMKVKFLQN